VRKLSSVLLFTLAAGCAGSIEGTNDIVSAEEPFSSANSTLLDAEWDGEIRSRSNTNLSGQIKSQVMYAIGQLNAEPGVARVSKLALTNIRTTYTGGLYKITYHAKMPVAWGSKTDLPTTYTFTLPKRIDQTGQTAFLAKYAPTCSDAPSDATLGNYWYHYRPDDEGCTFDPLDVTVSTAAMTVSAQNTTAKYPEFHKIWEDGAFNVVVIFGKYERGATSPWDAGISAWNEFYRTIRTEMGLTAVIQPAVTGDPGAENPAIVLTKRLPGGEEVTVTMLLVDELASTTAAWDARYAKLTPGADFILYNGHAGLGANVRALSSKGKWFPGKWQLFFFNGCDTFAYADDTLAKTRALLNTDDPKGTKYMDVVTNAMPAYFHSLTGASMALIRAALSYMSSPKTYEEIFSGIDDVQLVNVDGEADNVFTPDYAPAISWNGFEAKDAVGYREVRAYQTELLAPGKYTFTMLHDALSLTGDSDLRVRAGAAPGDTLTYKCKSYALNSNERCTLTLTTPQIVYITAKGDWTGGVSPFYIRAYQRE
jgi:hypothetical protein